MTINNSKIGLIGLGIMGLPMARNIKKAGFTISVSNRSKDKLKVAEKEGLPTTSSYKDLTNQSDVIIIMVTDPKAVDNVMNNKEGVFFGKVLGKTLIQMSTIDEKTTLAIAEQARSKGMKFIDCPVAGSKKQVEAAELILLAGGDESLIKEYDPLLKAMGKTVVHAGDIGKGTALKLCMNLIVSQMTTAICEATALAKIQNIDPKKIFEVIKESPAINCGYFKIKEQALINSDFSPAFSLNNMLKDVIFMTEAAKSGRLGLPVTQAVRFLMEGTSTEGFGDEDLTAITRMLKPHPKRN